jgi:hypothetical protein
VTSSSDVELPSSSGGYYGPPSPTDDAMVKRDAEKDEMVAKRGLVRYTQSFFGCGDRC